MLLCQRRENTSHPLKWEFPGGKIEDTETPREALHREMVEELALDVTIGDELISYDFTYPNGLTVDLTFYEIEDFTPQPVNLAFTDIRWVSISNLDRYDILEGDVSIVNYLQLLHDS